MPAPRPAVVLRAVSSPGSTRLDVQGLRAVAVLLVMLAHVGVPLLPGGFVGRRRVLRGLRLPDHRAAAARAGDHRPDPARRVLRPPRATDPPGGDRGAAGDRRVRRRHPARLSGRRGGHRCQVVGALPGQRPLRPGRRRLLRAGPGDLTAPALLVPRGRGAVLPGVAGAARAAARRPRSTSLPTPVSESDGRGRPGRRLVRVVRVVPDRGGGAVGLLRCAAAGLGAGHRCAPGSRGAVAVAAPGWARAVLATAGLLAVGAASARYGASVAGPELILPVAGTAALLAAGTMPRRPRSRWSSSR